jgi:hypothetical protein
MSLVVKILKLIEENMHQFNGTPSSETFRPIHSTFSLDVLMYSVSAIRKLISENSFMKFLPLHFCHVVRCISKEQGTSSVTFLQKILLLVHIYLIYRYYTPGLLSYNFILILHIGSIYNPISQVFNRITYFHVTLDAVFSYLTIN